MEKNTRIFFIYPLIIIFTCVFISVLIQKPLLAVLSFPLGYVHVLIYGIVSDIKTRRADAQAREKYAYLIGREVKIESVVSYTECMYFHLDGVIWRAAYDNSREPKKNRYQITEIINKDAVRLKQI